MNFLNPEQNKWMSGIDTSTNEQHPKSIRYVANYNNSSSNFIQCAKDTVVELPNDGVGSFSVTNGMPPGVSSLLDSSTGRLDFSGLTLMTSVVIRSTFRVKLLSNNTQCDVLINPGFSSPSSYTETFGSHFFSNGAGVQPFDEDFYHHMYIGSEDIKNSPTRLMVKFSESAEIKNVGVVLWVHLR